MPPCTWAQRRRLRFRNMAIAWSLTGACLFTLSTFKSDGQRRDVAARGAAPRLRVQNVSALAHGGTGMEDNVQQSTGNVEGVSIVQVAAGVAGGDFTTSRLFLSLGPSALNAYAIYGTPQTPLSFPPAYQCPAPFGVHIGGTSAHSTKSRCLSVF